MDEFLKSIEEGNEHYNFNTGLVLVSMLGSSIRNNVYLEHVIEELYPNKKKRAKIFKDLEIEFQNKSMITSQCSLLGLLTLSERKTVDTLKIQI